LFDRSDVCDDLSVVRPYEFNSLSCANACTSWVAAGSEPVILGCACGSCSESSVGSSVDRCTENSLGKYGIVGHDSRSQMVRHSLESVQHLVNILVLILGDDLERPEQLSSQQLELLGVLEMPKRYINRCGLVRSINCWNSVGFCQRLATKQDLSTLKFHHCINMRLNFFIVP